jgi:hypothetical protein
MKLHEVVGGIVAVLCFVGAVYCALLRGEACFHSRKFDPASGHTERLRCKSAGVSYGTPREAWWMGPGMLLLWLGAGAGGYLFTWDERQRAKR